MTNLELLARRLRAIKETSGALTGVYPPGALEELRADWGDDDLWHGHVEDDRAVIDESRAVGQSLPHEH